MNIEEFINHFAEQFEETPNEEFAADTEYKGIEEWDSMMAITIIAMVDEVYNVTIKAEDIRSTETIEDLAELVKGRL